MPNKSTRADSKFIPAQTRFANHRAVSSMEATIQAIAAVQCRDDLCDGELSNDDIDQLTTMMDRSRKAIMHLYKLREREMTKRETKLFKRVAREIKKFRRR
jgi:hypothetical protein